ncbi:hypothetical protein NIES970_24820 [[Synechococcus] sp. NIES-970]|uniref:hypothetical protein n=1 Tax=Picosynechococcus sp. NKBG15041c TaxID=1407650 RepID=UPI000428B705|nr:hypothetical protein [Picosynechococcus sp. NKBG15041c]BAW97530.1 hypothetical protein NIES970_24820 [[Synechococcus] sp. NIES-970]
MSAALEEKMTTNIMPEVITHTPEKTSLNTTTKSKTESAPQTSPATTKAGESPLLGLILVFPFVFLALIALVVIERLVKWGWRKFVSPRIAPQKESLQTLTPSPW